MSKTKLSISLMKEGIPINRVLKPDIPFFSKVSFRSVSSRLKHYGFKVSIKGINRTYRDPNNDGGNEE